MKILCSRPSPYSAKVRMAAQYCGFDAAAISEFVVTNDDPDLLTGNNPLGKIPTLITDDGQAVYDSRAIMQYLDRISGGKLYPADAKARTQVEVLEALSDGITDCLVAQTYEVRFRPEEKVHQPWIDRQWSKVERGLDHIQANPPVLTEGLNGAHLAIAAMTGYLRLRFAGRWEERWPWVTEFSDTLAEKHPELTAFAPQ